MSAGTFGSVRTTEPPVLTNVEVTPRPGAWNMMDSSTLSFALSGFEQHPRHAHVDGASGSPVRFVDRAVLKRPMDRETMLSLG